MRKEKRRELRESWAQLTRSQSFIIACHQRPDGDALGSALALASVLRGEGKDVVVVCEDGVPDNYKFLPEADAIFVSTDRRGFDVGVLVDCESVKRIGSAADALLSSSTTACIDHHLPNGEFGDIRIIDPEASATAELVYELFSANGIKINTMLATQLMAGIVADTGAFRFANTNARTFRIASRLAAAGARASDIAREIYESHSLPAMQLLGRALCSLALHPSGRIVWAQVTKNDLDELGATDADTEGIVNLVRWVKGPDVAILFRETKPGSVRISLRSTDGFDVERVARVFGGGGHKAAAGCTIQGSLESARDRLIGEVLRWMESST